MMESVERGRAAGGRRRCPSAAGLRAARLTMQWVVLGAVLAVIAATRPGRRERSRRAATGRRRGDAGPTTAACDVDRDSSPSDPAGRPAGRPRDPAAAVLGVARPRAVGHRVRRGGTAAAAAGRTPRSARRSARPCSTPATRRVPARRRRGPCSGPRLDDEAADRAGRARDARAGHPVPDTRGPDRRPRSCWSVVATRRCRNGSSSATAGTTRITRLRPARPRDRGRAAGGRAPRRCGSATPTTCSPDRAVNPAWEPGYVPTGEVAPVSALSLDGGRTRPGLRAARRRPSRFAAERFAALLGSYGMQVEGAPAPTADAERGAAGNDRVADGCRDRRPDARSERQRRRRDAGAARGPRRGLEPTFAGARASDRGSARADSACPTDGLVLADGSGLSRQNRIAPITLARALEVAYEDDDGSSAAMLTGLPVAGFTGIARQPIRRRREQPRGRRHPGQDRLPHRRRVARRLRRRRGRPRR